MAAILCTIFFMLWFYHLFIVYAFYIHVVLHLLNIVAMAFLMVSVWSQTIHSIRGASLRQYLSVSRMGIYAANTVLVCYAITFLFIMLGYGRLLNILILVAVLAVGYFMCIKNSDLAKSLIDKKEQKEQKEQAEEDTEEEFADFEQSEEAAEEEFADFEQPEEAVEEGPDDFKRPEETAETEQAEQPMEEEQTAKQTEQPMPDENNSGRAHAAAAP